MTDVLVFLGLRAFPGYGRTLSAESGELWASLTSWSPMCVQQLVGGRPSAITQVRDRLEQVGQEVGEMSASLPVCACTHGAPRGSSLTPHSRMFVFTVSMSVA